MFIHFIVNGFSLHSNYKITNKVTIHMGILAVMALVLVVFLFSTFVTIRFWLFFAFDSYLTTHNRPNGPD